MTRETRHTAKLRLPIASFSHAVRYGDLTIVGAKGSVSPTSASIVASGDPAGQTERVLQSIEIALGELDTAVAGLVQLRVWIADFRQGEAIRAVLERRLVGAPVVSILHSPAFPVPGFLVEVDALAADRSIPRELLMTGDARDGIRAGSVVVLEDVVGGSGRDGCAEVTPGQEFERALKELLRRLGAHGLDESRLMRVDVRLAHPRYVPLFCRVWSAALATPRPPCVVTCSHLSEQQARVQVSALASMAPVDRVTYADLGFTQSSARRESAGARSAGLVLAVGGPPGPAAYPPEAESGPGAALDTMLASLAALGATGEQILRVTATMPDWRTYREFDEAYSNRLHQPFPARTTVQAQMPYADTPLQVEAIAGLDGQQTTLLVS